MIAHIEHHNKDNVTFVLLRKCDGLNLQTMSLYLRFFFPKNGSLATRTYLFLEFIIYPLTYGLPLLELIFRAIASSPTWDWSHLLWSSRGFHLLPSLVRPPHQGIGPHLLRASPRRNPLLSCVPWPTCSQLFVRDQ